MNKRNIGIIGATSLVGKLLISNLLETECKIVAFTRGNTFGKSTEKVTWQNYSSSLNLIPRTNCTQNWICAAPIWVLPEHFQLMELKGVRRIVVISSTSRYGKLNSTDSSEKELANRLAEAEFAVQKWAEDKSIEWVILRPTLIYGLAQDKNITEIAGFVSRFGFFPVFGKAQGLRQPIHVDDVAKACVSALFQEEIKGASYNISGSESLPYREMVKRIFLAMGRRPILISIPLWLFRIAFSVIKFIPKYHHWSPAMAQRINQDLVFDHFEAEKDFNFQSRGFVLTDEDLPR